MPESQAANETFLLEHWKQSRLELKALVSRCVDLERYALISTGAIWAWLGTAEPGWDPALKWLPLLLNVLFALRALSLVLRYREVGGSLAAAETHFSVPPDLKLEKPYNPRRIKMITAWVFWLLLLAATLVLPYFYAERGAEFDCDQGQTMTFRVAARPATASQRRGMQPGGIAGVLRARPTGAGQR